MAILKRFEIWLLFILVVGVVVFVVKNSGEPDLPLSKSTPEEKEVPQTVDPKRSTKELPSSEEEQVNLATSETGKNQLLRVENVVSTDTGNGRIVDLMLTGRSGTGATVSLDESLLTVRTPEGEEVPRFFTPFRAEPVLDSDQDTLITVQLWVIDSPESLWVEYRDQRIKADLPR